MQIDKKSVHNSNLKKTANKTNRTIPRVLRLPVVVNNLKRVAVTVSRLVGVRRRGKDERASWKSIVPCASTVAG